MYRIRDASRGKSLTGCRPGATGADLPPTPPKTTVSTPEQSTAMSPAPAPIRTSAPAPAPAPTDAHAPASAPCYTVQRTSQTPTMALIFISKVTSFSAGLVFSSWHSKHCMMKNALLHRQKGAAILEGPCIGIPQWRAAPYVRVSSPEGLCNRHPSVKNIPKQIISPTMALTFMSDLSFSAGNFFSGSHSKLCRMKGLLLLCLTCAVNLEGPCIGINQRRAAHYGGALVPEGPCVGIPQ